MTYYAASDSESGVRKGAGRAGPCLYTAAGSVCEAARPSIRSTDAVAAGAEFANFSYIAEGRGKSEFPAG